jgi:hypothetical protein
VASGRAANAGQALSINCSDDASFSYHRVDVARCNRGTARLFPGVGEESRPASCGTVEKMSMGGKVAVMRGGNREPVRSDCASPHVDQVSCNRLARIGAAARTGASEAYEGQEK